MSPKKIIPTDVVCAQLRSAQGNVSHVAKQLGVSRDWLHKYINAHDTVKAALHDIREGILDQSAWRRPRKYE